MVFKLFKTLSKTFNGAVAEAEAEVEAGVIARSIGQHREFFQAPKIQSVV